MNAETKEPTTVTIKIGRMVFELFTDTDSVDRLREQLIRAKIAFEQFEVSKLPPPTTSLTGSPKQ